MLASLLYFVTACLAEGLWKYHQCAFEASRADTDFFVERDFDGFPSHRCFLHRTCR